MANRVGDDASEALRAEQRYVDELYRRLDALRERAARRRGEVLLEEPPHEQARLLREDKAEMYTAELARLASVDAGLCFGRLDFAEGGYGYIGRIGLQDSERNSLLVDWRAPAARSFYTATAANPEGVRRRRHLRTRRRTVVGLSDEVLDLTEPQAGGREELTGEAALLAALDVGRSGRMNDIVATIQAEQDRIIRSELEGVLVVDGGPGTGKTAVALHRAAYLLYRHRERLAKRGVLLVGPNSTFLRYISDVLPGLAETEVLLRTVGQLYPGVEPEREESPEAAAVKGEVRMVEVLRAAVADRQRLPERAVAAETEYGTLEAGVELITRARDRARAKRLPHNRARPVFAETLFAGLADQAADRIGVDPLEEDGGNFLDQDDRAAIAAELAREPEVLAVLDWLWPELTPQQLLAGLWGRMSRIAAAAPHLDREQAESLLREPHSGWTEADVPLLDEAAELLGPIPDRAAEKERRRVDQAAAYARGVLDIVTGSRSVDFEDVEEDDREELLATDVLDAALLGERHREREHSTVAERAAADRRWTFGHVVVDEAQELSAMAWRMLMRRCVSRSMTAVGDLAQAGDASAPATWSEALEPYVADRWRRERLTVGYRTPAEIMDVAADTLRRIDPDARPPRAVRRVGEDPTTLKVPEAELASRAVAEVRGRLDDLGEGRAAVIAPPERLAGLRSALGPVSGTEPDESEAAIRVLTPRQAKGLEFDVVAVLDPEGVAGSSARGLNDLYVAQTRATRTLIQLFPD